MRAAILAKLSPIHNGLVEFIKLVYAEAESVFFLVGGSSKQSIKYPFSYTERVTMLKRTMTDCFNNKDYSYGPVEGVRGNDQKWLEQIISAYGDRFDVLYSGNPHVRKIFSDNDIAVKSHNLDELISATSIRERIISGEPYQHLVPKAVFDYLQEIDAHTRLCAFNEELPRSAVYDKYANSKQPFVPAQGHNLSSMEEFSQMIISINEFTESELIYQLEWDSQNTLKLITTKDSFNLARLKGEYLEILPIDKLVSIMGTTHTDIARYLFNGIEELQVQ